MAEPERTPPNPYRILFVSQPTSGGVGVCVKEQVIHAMEAGFNPALVVPPTPVGLLAELSCPTNFLGMRRQPELIDLRHIFALRRLFKSTDLVHLHSSKAGALGRLAALTMTRSRRPAVIFTPHAWSWLVGGRMSWVYKLVERLLASTADVIIAVSQAEADEGRRALGPSAKIEAVPNGVDLDRFAPVPGVRHDRPLLVCVGRLAHQKGQDVAIRALGRMENTDVRLRLVGDGDLETELRELADHLDIADRVEWVPETADTAAHLQQADIVVVPSRWDGMSLVFLEALAVGAPIVASRVNGVEAGAGAISLVPPGDDSALASELDSLLSDPEKRHKLAAMAREAAMAYDLRDSLSATQRIWEKTLAGVRGS